MSKVVSLRLKDEQFERLQRAARRLGRTPSQSAMILLEEALRLREFPFIEFRDTVVGRDAFIKGSRLKAWQVVILVRAYDGDTSAVAEALDVPQSEIQAAVSYAAAHPAEIEAAIEDNHPSVEELRRRIPGLEVLTCREDPA